MAQYLVRRTLAVLPTVLITSVITFALGFYGPGDAARTILGANWANEQEYQRIRRDLGLDRPFVVQYVDYMGRAVRGDFGMSLSHSRPVGTLMAQALPITVQLAATAVAVIALLGIPLGIVSALKQYSWIDRVTVTGFTLIHAVPPYVLAPMLLVLFVLNLNILPIGVGWDGLFRLEMIIPVLVLTSGPLIFVVRQMRNSVLDVLNEDYVRTARAKGMTRRIVVMRHMLPNALTPALSQIGVIFASLLVSSIFVEDIFGLPGFGSLIVGGLLARDYPLLMGTVLVSVVLITLINLVTDLLYGVLDPRVRLGKETA